MYSINKVHFYNNYIPLTDVLRKQNELISIVKYVLILKTQYVFENTQCLDLRNATCTFTVRHVVWYDKLLV